MLLRKDYTSTVIVVQAARHGCRVLLQRELSGQSSVLSLALAVVAHEVVVIMQCRRSTSHQSEHYILALTRAGERELGLGKNPLVWRSQAQSDWRVTIQT